MIPTLIVLLVLAAGGFYAYTVWKQKQLPDGNGNGNGDGPPPLPEPTYPFTPKVTTFPMPTGIYYDYVVDQNTGKGYLLSLTGGRQLRMSVYDPSLGQFSDYETVYQNGPRHRLQFNVPRIALTDSHIFVAWGEHSKKENGLYLMKRPIAGGAWTTRRTLLPAAHIEFFNLAGYGSKLYIVFFALDPEGFHLADENGKILNSSKNILMKDIEVAATHGPPVFLGRFRNISAVEVLGPSGPSPKLGHEVWAGSVNKPVGEKTKNGSLMVTGWDDWKNEGEDWWPTNLIVRGKDKGTEQELKRIGRHENEGSTHVSALTEVGGKVRVFYDYKGSVYMQEPGSEPTFLMKGITPVAKSWGRERCDVITSEGVVVLKRPS